MFPVVFYLLTQTVFASTGVDFSTTGLLFAAGLTVGLPIVAEIVFRILPEATSRVETYLLLMVFITVLGLIATETGRMVYSVKEEPTDLRALLLTFSGFALMFLVGIVVNKIKNRLEEINQLITASYEDKTFKRITEDLLNVIVSKYQKEQQDLN